MVNLPVIAGDVSRGCCGGCGRWCGGASGPRCRGPALARVSRTCRPRLRSRRPGCVACLVARPGVGAGLRARVGMPTARVRVVVIVIGHRVTACESSSRLNAVWLSWLSRLSSPAKAEVTGKARIPMVTRPASPIVPMVRL